VATDADSDRPIGEQLIDLFIGKSKERYTTFESIRAFDARSPFYRTGPDESAEREVGSFLNAWIALEKIMRQRVGGGPGSKHALWLQGQIPGVSQTVMQEIQNLRKLRNELVHGIQVPTSDTLASATKRIRVVIHELSQTKAPTTPKRRRIKKTSSR
jgi:hypothetical protein